MGPARMGQVLATMNGVDLLDERMGTIAIRTVTHLAVGDWQRIESIVSERREAGENVRLIGFSGERAFMARIACGGLRIAADVAFGGRRPDLEIRQLEYLVQLVGTLRPDAGRIGPGHL